MVNLKMLLIVVAIFVRAALLGARHVLTQAMINAQQCTTDIGWMALQEDHALLDVRLALMGPHVLLALPE